MPIPHGLGERGTAMWEALTKDREYDAAWEVLIVEACRIADRLEKLDQMLRRDASVWARIEIPEVDGKACVLIFDDALGEARQQQNALRQIVTSLKLGNASESKSGGSALDELFARRAKNGVSKAAG